VGVVDYGRARVALVPSGNSSTFLAIAPDIPVGQEYGAAGTVELLGGFRDDGSALMN